MIRPIAIVFLLLLASAIPMRADDIYTVTVNTSSISGTSGSLDFQFDPGLFPGSQAANLSIVGFTTDGTLGTPAPTGDVSGTLPGTLAFDNLTSFNDYFTTFTYGSTISFTVDLSGPAISAPNEASDSGSSFYFFMFSDPNGYDPILASSSSPFGQALEVDVNLDGSTTPSVYSAQLSATAVTPTPEPGTLLLLVSALSATMLLGLRRKAAELLS
jgi:hypothetical protein